MDLRFVTPGILTICGATNTGKTTLALNILAMKDKLFDDPDIENVVFYFNHHQELYRNFEKQNIVTRWVHGLPSVEEVKEDTENYRKSIIVIDDFAHQIDNNILELFTVLTHHGNIFTIYLTQFLFGKQPIHRAISLQSTYIILFKNPRDSQQIENLARQLKSRNYKYIIDAYNEATKKPYSYILFDNHQKTDDRVRIRSRMLPNEGPMIAWTQRKN